MEKREAPDLREDFRKTDSPGFGKKLNEKKKKMFGAGF